MTTGAAVEFRQRRLDDRREGLASATVFAADPILQLLEELEEDHRTLDRLMLSSEHLESFRTRLIEACERATSFQKWLPPSQVAKLVDRDTDTVRRWCRRSQVRYRETPTGYLVNVQHALELAGMA